MKRLPFVNDYLLVTCVVFVMMLAACSGNKKTVETANTDIKQWKNKVQELHTGEIQFVELDNNIAADQLEKEAFKKAKLDIATSKLKQISDGSVMSQLKLDERQLGSINRQRISEIEERLEALQLVDQTTDNDKKIMAFALNEKAYNEITNQQKMDAFADATELMGEYQEALKVRDVQKAANLLSEAMLALQPHLGEDLQAEINTESVSLDQYIFDEMKALNANTSLNTIPSDTVVLNRLNEYVEFVNLTVNYGEQLSEPIPLKIDLAGVRQQSLVVNKQDILVSDIPVKKTNPYLSIKADLFSKLREEGNMLAKLIYKELKPIQKYMNIRREWPLLTVVPIKPDSNLIYQEVKMVTRELALLGFEMVERDDAEDVIAVNWIFRDESVDPATRNTGQWAIMVNDKVVPARPVRATHQDATIAGNKVVDQLQMQLREELIDKIVKELVNARP